MTRLLLSFCLGSCLLALLPARDAGAVEMPVRKAGLWEIKMVRTGSPQPEMTMQHCTDETIDKQMNTALAPMKETYSKNDIQKTATGYVTDSVCSVGGMSMTSHSETSGDRGEVVRGLQTRPEARRHRDARRLQAEHQGRG